MPTGADIVVKQLMTQGVEWISTLCGNGMDPLYRACCSVDMDVIDTHNEQAAAYMADAYARLTGNLGVCAVSSGIAHVNALTGIANAHFDRAPVLLITGASGGYGADRGVFQEFDQVGLAEPICKYSSWVSRPEDIQYQVRTAISTAINEPPGPVHLTIPSDVLGSEVSAVKLSPVARVKPPLPERDGVLSAAKMLEDSTRPFLVVGTGCLRSTRRESILEFSEKFSVPFGVPIWDRGCIENRHPNFMGVLGSASGEPELLEDADLVIVAGSDVDYRIGYLSPPKTREDLLRVSIGWSSFPREAGFDLGLAGDPGRVLGEIVKNAEGGGHERWLNTCQRRLELFRSPWGKTAPGDEVSTGRDIVEAIRPLLDDVVFLIDGGNIGQWAHMLLVDRYPSHWLTCGASAVVGWGVPGAMAARRAYPERDILLLSGDGAFGFTPAEMESAVRQKLSFVSVVANDSAWGIVVCGQRGTMGDETVACETGEIRYDQVARGFGARGLRTTWISEIREGIQEGFGNEVPTVIDVPIGVASPTDARS